jgi:3-hydroxyisobutyrate dehydrogenase
MKIALFGTGLMGQAMVKRLVATNAGEVTAYNRTPTKLEPLKDAGIAVTSNAAQAIEAGECLILMLADAKAIQAVIFPHDSLLNGRTVIQMGTIAPNESKEIAQFVTQAGGEYLEAPVLGSIPQVKAGKLQVMVGATPDQLKTWSNVLQPFGEPVHIGAVGTAAALKLALNQLIASLTSAFSLSLGLILREGVEVDKFMGILRESALHASQFDKKLDRMQNRDFSNPNFPTKHLLKDTNLFLQQAQADGLNTDSLAGVQKVIEKALEMGLTDQDYSSIYNAVNQP